VTLGLSHRDRNFGVAASASSLFEAMADLDVEVIATLSAAQLEPGTRVPDNVRVVEFVPLNVLLPTCSAIVHSGGAGTFAAAVENGVPQLIVPNTYWSERWWGPLVMANGIEEQGAGVYVGDADQVTADMLHDSLSRVLKMPQYAANAARLAAEVVGMPSPNEIVPALERLTREHRGRHRRSAAIAPAAS
jgi:UDP:flavonoid glycosyltransferase YjiC (YdhE family)